MADCKLHGTQPYGLKHHNGKLADSEVLEILRLRDSATKTEIARRFGISRRWVSDILAGKARTHLESTQ